MRKAGNYLKDTVIPRLVADLSSLEVSPMDGPTLTDALHAHGINIRYLGQVRTSLCCTLRGQMLFYRRVTAALCDCFFAASGLVYNVDSKYI